MSINDQHLFEKDPEHPAVLEFREGLAERGVTDPAVQNEIMTSLENTIVKAVIEQGLLKKSEE